LQFGLRTQGVVATHKELLIATVGSVLSHRTSGFGDEVLLLGLRFELFVDDAEASVSFYGATLGLVPQRTVLPMGMCHCEQAL
jgi:hypothetical protein